MTFLKATMMIINKKISKMKSVFSRTSSVPLIDTKKDPVEINMHDPVKNTFSVSVVIPTLNEEKHIEMCLNSLFCQTYYSNIIEILIVDGGSTDRTLEIVKKIRSNHSNITIINNTKKIRSAAFNIGIDNFKGDLLIRLDAHCTYNSNYIQYCAQYHLSYNYGNVGGKCSIEPGADTNMAKIIALVSASTFGLGFAAFRVGKKITLTDTVPFGSFTKKVLNDVGKMNESLPRGEDNEYNARIRKHGYKVLFDPKIISHYYGSADLNSFLRKFFTNGFSIGILLRISRSSVSFRHIVPVAYLLALAAGISLSFYYSFFKYSLLMLISIYLVIVLISAAKRFSKYKIRFIPVYIYVIFLVHLYYGVGTILGFIKGKYDNKT